MGFLMFLGLVGTMAYGTYFIKNETKAVVGDKILTPTHIKNKDRDIIKNNFKLICKRCDIDIDKNDNPVIEEGYKPCSEYLKYRGFHEDIVNYFIVMYQKKYNEAQKNKLKNMQYKHNNLLREYGSQPQKKTKTFKYWHSGNTEQKCKDMMKNPLWSLLVRHYNIVKDGNQNVEVWVITAPPSILKQIDDIHDEVLIIENNR